MTIYTIEQLETAINIYRSRNASDSDAALCKPARILAEPYAFAIVEHRTTIDASTLTPDQLAALTDVLSHVGAM